MRNQIIFLAVLFLLANASFATIVSKADMERRAAKEAEIERNAKAEGTIIFKASDTIDIRMWAIGSRTEKEVEKVMHDTANWLKLNKIYNNALKKKPGIKGIIFLNFTINADGKVEGFNIEHSTIKNTEFEETIKEYVNSYKWNPTKDGNTKVTVVFGFNDRKYFSYGIMIISGTRSKAELMQVINMRIPGIRNILNKFYNQQPFEDGNIVVKLVITANGDITGIDILSNTTNTHAFEDAFKSYIVDKFKWKPAEGENTTLIFKFSFMW